MHTCGVRADDCTGQQVIDKCVPDQDRAGVSYSTPPNADSFSLVPINLQLDLAPARLEIRPAAG